MSATQISKLVEKYGGVPASDEAFERELERAARNLHTWQFAKSLEHTVGRHPTPRGWAIAGYALASAGYLEEAIDCLKKGRQTNTTHEMIASCWFVLDKAAKGVWASKKSPDSELHVVQSAVKPSGPHSVNPLAWALALVYILGRPPVFGEGPVSGFVGSLALINMAVETMTAWQGASSGHPVFTLQLESHLEAWSNLGVDVSKPGVLGQLLAESQSEFWSAARRSSVTQVLQDLCSTGTF